MVFLINYQSNVHCNQLSLFKQSAWALFQHQVLIVNVLFAFKTNHVIIGIDKHGKHSLIVVLRFDQHSFGNLTNIHATFELVAIS